MARNNLELRISADDRQAQAAFRRLGQSVESIGPKAKGSLGRAAAELGAMVGAAGAAGAAINALGAGIQKAIADFAEFDAATRELNSILGLSEQEITQVSQSIVDLTREMHLGIRPAEAMRAAYDAASAGFADAASSQEILKAAMVASRAGSIEMSQAVTAITATLNAYQMRAADANRVTDMLQATVNAGNVRWEELSGAIGAVASTAKQANIPLEELLGAIATMTLSGKTASQSATGINQAILALIAPTGEAAKKLEGLKVSTADLIAITKSQGMAAGFQALIDATGGSEMELRKVLGSTEAVDAALKLAGDNAKRFADNVNLVGESTGVAMKAAEENAKSLETAWDNLGAASDRLGIALGKGLGPGLALTVDALADAVDRAVPSMPKLPKIVDAGEAGALREIAGEAQNLKEQLVGIGKTAEDVGRSNMFKGMVEAMLETEDLAPEVRDQLKGIANAWGIVADESKKAGDDGAAALEKKQLALDEELRVLENQERARDVSRDQFLARLEEMLTREYLTGDQRIAIERRVAGVQGQIRDEAARRMKQAEDDAKRANEQLVEGIRRKHKAEEERKKAADERQVEDEADALKQTELEILELRRDQTEDLKEQLDLTLQILKLRLDEATAGVKSPELKARLEERYEHQKKAAQKDYDEARKDADDKRLADLKKQTDELEKQKKLAEEAAAKTTPGGIMTLEEMVESQKRFGVSGTPGFGGMTDPRMSDPQSLDRQLAAAASSNGTTATPGSSAGSGSLSADRLGEIHAILSAMYGLMQQAIGKPVLAGDARGSIAPKGSWENPINSFALASEKATGSP